MTTTSTDRIETAVVIRAPQQRVWELVTRAEHLGRWFGDAGAEIDLRPGGAFVLHWEQERYTAHGRIESVEPPHRLVYRWLAVDDTAVEATPENSTRVEFALEAVSDATTRVTVTESGFDGLDLDPRERAERLASHQEGWPLELGHLAGHAPAVAR